MDDGLLSVKEFAKRAGISRQAVYSQLDTRLQPYVVKVDNRRMLKESALEKFYSSQVDSSIQSSFNQVEQPENIAAEQFDKVLETLREQLRVKDSQIWELNKRLSEMSETITRQSILIDQSQKLNLLDKKDKDTVKEATAEEKQEQPGRKKHFWERWFS